MIIETILEINLKMCMGGKKLKYALLKLFMKKEIKMWVTDIYNCPFNN